MTVNNSRTPAMPAASMATTAKKYQPYPQIELEAH